MDENNQIAKVFRALCDEKRVAIIRLLQRGEQCACHLAEALGLSQSKLSYHMKILCGSGIVACRYVGKWTYYQVSEQGSEEAMRMLRMLTTVQEQLGEQE